MSAVSNSIPSPESAGGASALLNLASVRSAPQGEVLAASVLLKTLWAHGVRHFFCNPGTDFPSIVEAFSMAEAAGEIGTSVPTPVVVPHENAAVAMAHGMYAATGVPQVVMVHVNVGTANMINGAANACRDQVPILLMAGRTPVTEKGLHGSRSRTIHWAQEMFDQAGMLREFVKWDQELKTASETANAVTRAMEVMMTSPRGPGYLALPREFISGQVKAADAVSTTRRLSSMPWPDPAAIDTLAQWVVAAKRPLIITSTAGRTAAGFHALSALAERFAIPVVTIAGRFVNIATDHPMHFGFQTKPMLQESDLVISLECDVPWLPSLESPPAGTRVVHVAEDPAFVRYPTRSFPVDLSITAGAATALTALHERLDARGCAQDAATAERRQYLAGVHDRMRAGWASQLEKARGDEVIRPELISRLLYEAAGDDAIFVNEYPLRLEHCPRTKPDTLYGSSPAGGLGWGLGAAIGVKLARPDKLVIATLGDGAYMFMNPTACHWVAAKHKAPILTVVYNNAIYGAVRNSTAAMYRDGVSGDKGCTMLADLSPTPNFEMVAQSSGAHGERVERASDLPAAIQRALEAIRNEGRQALLNVVCEY